MKNSLYIKNRPKTFSDIIGQETIVKILRNSLLTNNFKNTYLFHGIRGTGKTSTARIFSKALNCSSLSSIGDPCNNCKSCIDINDKKSFDVIELDAASNSGVEEIRKIITNSQFSTTYSRNKIYIIDEVHMLSKAAFNSLLKTLEEPPKDTFFLLATTEINRIPDTILSRSIILNLSPISKIKIKKGLKKILERENLDLSDFVLEYISLLSEGSFRDAISLMEYLLLIKDDVNIDNMFDMLNIISNDDIDEILLSKNKSIVDKIFLNENLDCQRISLLVIERLFSHLRKETNENYLNLIEKLVDMYSSVKNPFLFRRIFISILYGYCRSFLSKDDNKVHNVSRETLETEKNEDTPIKESLLSDNDDNNNDSESHFRETSEFKKRNVLLEEMNLNEEKAKSSNDSSELDVSRETNIKNSIINKTITSYLTTEDYIYIIINNDSSLFDKLNLNWDKIKDYSLNPKFKYISNILENSVLLKSINDFSIVGFKDQKSLENFKKISLDPLLFEFILEVFGEKFALFPIIESSWEKLKIMSSNLIKNKISPTFSPKIKIINKMIKDPHTKELKFARQIFGKKLKIDE